ncbi:helix-turn-helix domain-containing protein [Actinosynnema mirum]|uniref:Helix-turn-helix domain protein n=1 Tax=Actinosynnema mirum (strain ATCC 29888 / DSM 43827 / JCM 3225 / NBRC 14064 / NCIMB 13271 / NRRL B-12336 / IMRU 3971 / 101) TaxID=446462 RepID=C6WGR5_ACTMD|nr:helix-turn-helix transcriptional regulator [Actinosynnema mirum]ACU34381.1 helix-turn-helix domain protein [Actinosynnema mirum DSM 43827]
MVDRSAQHHTAVYKRKLGEVLETCREEAGLSRADAAAVLDCSTSKIRMIESGGVAVKTPELRELLTAYNITGERRADIETLGEHARQRRGRTTWGGAVPERLKRFFDKEETAVTIDSYSPWVLQGLAQTEAHARAVIQTNSLLSPKDVDRLVQARLARQERLHAQDAPKIRWAVDESVLRRPIGGAEVMRAQLEHLAALCRKDIGELRVIPNSVGAHAGCGFPFVVLVDAEGNRSVYVENLTDGSWIEDLDRVTRYEITMREIMDCALSTEESLRLVDTVLAQL